MIFPWIVQLYWWFSPNGYSAGNLYETNNSFRWGCVSCCLTVTLKLCICRLFLASWSGPEHTEGKAWVDILQGYEKRHWFCLYIVTPCRSVVDVQGSVCKESSHKASCGHLEMKRCRNARGNSATMFFSSDFFLWPLYFNQLDAKSKYYVSTWNNLYRKHGID